MKVTRATKELIYKRLRDKNKPKLTQKIIADRMGYGKAWVSKLLSTEEHAIQNLDEEQVEKLEGILGIRLSVRDENGEKVPEIARQIGHKMEYSPALAKAISSLLELAEEREVRFTPKWIETQDMTKLGQQIIRIAFANEDKPGKVARMILELLA